MKLLLAFLLPLLALCTDNPVRTIVDILSGSPEFSDILQLLQHNDLITLLNQSQNATFLAPVNSAFIGIDKHAITRDQLLYHIVNATVLSSDIEDPRVYKTYLDQGKSPVIMDLHSGVNHQASFIDVDMTASEGNGVVHSIAQIVMIPGTLREKFYVSKHLQTFASMLNIDPSNTLVLTPRSSAIRQWLAESSDENSAEILLNYLNSPFGEVEHKDFLYRHIVPDFSPMNTLPAHLKLRDGTEITVHKNLSVTNPHFEASPASKVHVARNGIYIELDDVLAPSAHEFLELTEEKFILGLGGHAMVRTLHLYGHQKLIDGHNHKEQIIIVPVPSPDEKDMLLPSVNGELSMNSVDPSKVSLYQFLNQKFPRKKRHALLDTKMDLRSGLHPQRVHFDRSRSGQLSLNWDHLSDTHYKLGNTTFYVSPDMLPTPSTLTLVLGPLLTSSYSLQFLEDLGLLQLPTSHSWTLIIPAREAWERNILMMQHLDKNETALEEVFANLVLSKPVYSDSGLVETHQHGGVPTNASFDDDRGVFTLSNNALNSSLTVDVADVLFDNGVVHIVSAVPLPETLEVGIEDLVLAAKRGYFIDLLKAADLGYVLDPHANFTVLVPPVHDLKKNNYTVETDPVVLRRMLSLHLLPGNPISSAGDGTTVETLEGEKLEIHSINDENGLIGLGPTSAQHGQRVLLFQYGHTNGLDAAGSTVILVDRHISPKWMLPDRFGPNGPAYAIVGIIFGLIMAAMIILGMVWYISKPIQLPEDEEADADREEEHDANTNDANEQTAEPMQTPGVNDAHRSALRDRLGV